MIISNIKVMKSNAGYYIGRTYSDDYAEDFPYDRVSNYFQSKDDCIEHMRYTMIYHHDDGYLCPKEYLKSI